MSSPALEGSDLGPGEKVARRLVDGVVVRAPEGLGEGAEHVADADHPEEVLSLDDGQVPDAALAHEPGDAQDVVVRGGGGDASRHGVADAHAIQVVTLR